MDKRIEELEARVNALTVESEKKIGEKKIRALRAEIEILAQIKEGSDYYKETLKKIESLANWNPGQIGEKGISTTEVFPTNDLEKVFIQTEIIAPKGTDIKSELKKAFPNWFILGKDWDFTKKDLSKKDGIIKRDPKLTKAE